MMKGVRGVEQKITFNDKGGGGLDPPKKADIIFEWPLKHLRFALQGHFPMHATEWCMIIKDNWWQRVHTFG